MAEPGSMAAPPPTIHPKQYVFVDEYNRHKRLKVMRACDGCRKRKIRCDGALQNGPWPCGACIRLKLKCVPPTQDLEDEQHEQQQQQQQQTLSVPTGPGQFTFQTTIANNNNINGASGNNARVTTPIDGYPTPASQPPDWISSAAALQSSTLATSSQASPLDTSIYATHNFNQPLGLRLDATYSHHAAADFSSASATSAPDASQFRPMPGLYRTPTDASSLSGGDPQEVDATVRELSGHMGHLTIEASSVAPWVANERKILEETPAVEEAEVGLPASVGSDSTVRIPPEMMPSEERAMTYFDYYFTYIHPYLPVLNKHAFYEQWRNARHSISPLLLEGLFASVATYLEGPYEVRRWLALASRHEESFKDVPRLSTIQAMIMLTKARESVPRRGYYYRSWMAVKYMTTMGFDLGLHEHLDNHRSGKCTLSPSDCLVHTRIWQTLFMLENLVGAPQGRTDYAVQFETVEDEVLSPTSNIDAAEYHCSRRFTYYVQLHRIIRQSNDAHLRLRRHRPDWGLDPSFMQHDPEFPAWLKLLPPDLQLHYPDDGGPPWLRNDHYVAYMHIYYHLCIIMQHRPQMVALLQKKDPAFKVQLDICLDSAEHLCRLQEALVREFGDAGLHFMLRGLNFTIYCVLSCLMLHLAAITSPDPALNLQARLYFTRHMRILEKCIPSASPEMQAQIRSLQEAFSKDVTQPFELKPNLGARSPATETRSSPIETAAPPVAHHSTSWSHLHDATTTNNISPVAQFGRQFDPQQQQHPSPPSRGPTSHPNYEYTAATYALQNDPTYTTTSLQHVTSASQIGYALEPVNSNDQAPTPVWDPSGIFQQWHTAFGAPPTTSPPRGQPQELMRSSPTLSGTMQQPQSQQSQHPGPTSHPASMYSSSPATATPVMPSNGATTTPIPESASVPTVPTVTPVMWQDAFTTAYVSGAGHKRYRQDDQHAVYDQYAKRRG